MKFMKCTTIILVLLMVICFGGCSNKEVVNNNVENQEDGNVRETDNKKSEKDTDSESFKDNDGDKESERDMDIDKEEKANLSDKGTISGIDYAISDINVTDSKSAKKYSQRGYLMDTENRPDAPYYFYICSGVKSSAGNKIEVVDIKIDKSKNVKITVKETKPAVGEVSAMVMTYPCVLVTLQTYPNDIVIRNTEGEEFKRLN
ncbi:MAG: protease complex subunit PrcB family protein [Lachnospiraceae bacterium]|nr:protease complex subunit PrcB family protein [Lachnospiraceae bacterium]